MTTHSDFTKEEQERFERYFEYSKTIPSPRRNWSKDQKIEGLRILGDFSDAELQSIFTPIRILNNNANLSQIADKTMDKKGKLTERYKSWYTLNKAVKPEQKSKTISLHGTSSKVR